MACLQQKYFRIQLHRRNCHTNLVDNKHAHQFLYKKGFHTARLDIQDKVWQAEQKRDEEARKTAELRRQIEDERAVQDLRAQMGGNVNGPSTDTGLEWMYAGVRKSVAEKQDESEVHAWKQDGRCSCVCANESLATLCRLQWWQR